MCNLRLICEEMTNTTFNALPTLRGRDFGPFTAWEKPTGPRWRNWGSMTHRWKPSSWPSLKSWPSYRDLQALVRHCKRQLPFWYGACFSKPRLASKVGTLVSFASNRKNICWPEDCSGFVVQWESVEHTTSVSDACGVLHKPRPGSVPGG